MAVRAAEVLAIGVLASAQSTRWTDSSAREVEVEVFAESLLSLQRTVALGYHHDTITGGWVGG
jgi:hypothetical protein